MKLISKLLSRVFNVLIWILLIGCLPPYYICERCEEVNLKIGFTNPGLYIDSIVYLPKGTKVFYTDQPYYIDTLETFLRLNQLDSTSTFLIYSSLTHTDTVVFKHSFEVRYDERCEEHFFDLNGVEPEFISPDDYVWDPAKTQNACAGTLEIYY